MLHTFLVDSESEILAMTEHKTLELAGARPSSTQLKQGLPIFFRQLLEVLRLARDPPSPSMVNRNAMVNAADAANEPALAQASGRPDEAALAKSAGAHGAELLRLGYTLSHVVHAYGAICQAITEIASTKEVRITPREFHDLNRCLDVAIAGAVTEFQSECNAVDRKRETEQLGFLVHEQRNALNSITIALRLMKKGAVGFNGSTGRVLDRGLLRMQELIDRSLTEVRLRIDPTLHIESKNLLQLVDQIVVTTEVEAQSKNQILEIQIDPALIIEADQHLYYSVLSNIIQNAIKFTRTGGRIQVRANVIGTQLVVEVEDECGGLSPQVAADLFKPFVQQHENRTGLGLGLTIAQQAIKLNHGTIDIRNLPGKGCVFKITLPVRQ